MRAQRKIKIIVIGLFALLVGVSMTACKGSSGGQSRTQDRFYNGDDWFQYDQNGLRQNNCRDCSNANVVADVAGGIDSFDLHLEMGLSLFSSNQYGSNDYYDGYSSYSGNFSSGNVEARGYMQVHRSQPTTTTCPLPYGGYEVNTLREGNLVGLTLTNGITLEAISIETGIPVIFKFSNLDMLQIQTFNGLDQFNYQLGFHGYVNITVQAPQGPCNGGYQLFTTVSLPNMPN